MRVKLSYYFNDENDKEERKILKLLLLTCIREHNLHSAPEGNLDKRLEGVLTSLAQNRFYRFQN